MENMDRLLDSKHYWKQLSYSTEAEYYEKEWGGVDCPVCGSALSKDGRKHKFEQDEEYCTTVYTSECDDTSARGKL